MTKKEYIEYWKSTAELDWVVIQHLFKSKDYMQALFFAHLVLEKLTKAHWVKVHESNHPPRIHNLITLINNTQLNPDENQRIFLEKMNTFQIEGRYTDYRMLLYKMCNKKFTEQIICKQTLSEHGYSNICNKSC